MNLFTASRTTALRLDLSWRHCVCGCFVTKSDFTNKWIKRVWFHLWLFIFREEAENIFVANFFQLTNSWHNLHSVTTCDMCCDFFINPKRIKMWRLKNELITFRAENEEIQNRWSVCSLPMLKHANKLQKSCDTCRWNLEWFFSTIFSFRDTQLRTKRVSSRNLNCKCANKLYKFCLPIETCRLLKWVSKH